MADSPEKPAGHFLELEAPAGAGRVIKTIQVGGPWGPALRLALAGILAGAVLLEAVRFVFRFR